MCLNQDRVSIHQWKDEIHNAFQLSSQILGGMNRKVRNKYGADTGVMTSTESLQTVLPDPNSNGC